MKITVITILALLFLSFLFGDTKITFNPFSVKIQSPFMMAFFIFFVISLSCFQLHVANKYYKKGREEGYKKGFLEMRDMVLEELDKIGKEK